MNQRIRVVSGLPSRETIEMLTDLLEEAQRGQLIGLAGVAMYARRRYEYALAGEGRRSPTYAVGAVAGLQAYITHQISQPPE